MCKVFKIIGYYMNGIGVPSMEFMKLQDDSFFEELKAIVAKIRQDKELTTKTVYESGLEAAIFKRLKMAIEVNVTNNPRANAAIELPSMDRNHIFIRALTRSFPNDIGKTISYFGDEQNRIGWVDIEKVQLGGVFSQIPLNMYINRGMFADAFTDGEIVSAILHELGHGFTFFYYLLHSSTVNFITARTVGDLSGAKGDDQRKIIIEKGMRYLGLDGVSVQEYMSMTPEQIASSIQALYINSTLNNLRSETGFGMYELRACEQLADWFANKFGAGLDSARLEEKLYSQSLKIAAANTARSRFSMQTAILYGAYAIQVTIPFPRFFSEIFYDETISRYDNDVERVRYMRQSLIEELRDTQLPEEVTKKLLKDIDGIKEVEGRLSKEINTVGSSIAVFLKKRLIANYRRNVKNIELQKTIEEALYNESYVSAAKLKGAIK